MTKHVRNFTPHPVIIAGETFPSEGKARIEEERRESIVGFPEFADGLPFATIRNGRVVGLPDGFEESSDWFIVSRLVAMAVGLPHVVAPDGFIRDDLGNILSATGVAWFPKGE